MSAWKIYAWSRAKRAWGLVGQTASDEAAELAVRTIVSKGSVAKAEREGEEMRGSSHYFSHIKYLGCCPGTA
jgi:hypothetical protein